MEMALLENKVCHSADFHKEESSAFEVKKISLFDRLLMLLFNKLWITTLAFVRHEPTRSSFAAKSIRGRHKFSSYFHNEFTQRLDHWKRPVFDLLRAQFRIKVGLVNR
jgi:hypothetical protein